MAGMVEARECLQKGQVKKALNITRRFRLGLSKEQRRDMERAWECLARPGFYAQLGFDEGQLINVGIETMTDILKEN